MVTFDDAHEAALLEALRSVAEGSLVLWINPADYDLLLGPLHPIPRVEDSVERPVGIPDWVTSWGTPLVRRGWVEPAFAGTRPYYRITEQGRRALPS